MRARPPAEPDYSCPFLAVAILRGYNRWRRGDENYTQPDPRAIGQAIDAVCDGCEALLRERDELREALATAINDFVEKVERRAEEKMLLTGKLEGAHYAAMKQLQKEMEAAK